MLACQNADRIIFDKAAIMRRAYALGRFALRLVRDRRQPAAARYAMLSRFLKLAWAEAKIEAAGIARRIEEAAYIRAALAERAKANAALAARHGGAEGLRRAIQSEHYAQHMNFAAVDRLAGALASIGG